MAKQLFDDSKFTGIRLPTSIKPIHYELWLKPNFEDFTFAGKVAINYQCQGGELTNDIVLHSLDLNVTEGSLNSDSGSNPLTTVTYSPGSETATLEFQDKVVPNGRLNLTFKGVLNDKLKGFYRTGFKIGSSQVYAATTQFEATDARRCFPCWDEPAVKATFSVTMVIEKYMSVDGVQYERLAISNMPEISRSGSDSELEVKFDKSPIMSTYLLAFVVGPFEMIEGSDGRRPIRVYTTPGKKELGRFALDVSCKSLPYYEDYFNIKFPLPKMDLIAIPDFCSGAMENWGLVTYRESCLLVDPQNTSTASKQWIALVVAHELAHQWFGNLVTMEWWTHLWLNEGFASFMEFLCVDHIFPEYDIWSQFVFDSYGRALKLDALHNSHPIEIPVGHPSEIDEIFDAISYSKGASVIRMLYTYIGDAAFRKGMEQYLNKFAYKNAQTEDLWESLEAASNKPVKKLMSGWTAQKGYPWIHVDISSEGDKDKLTLTQNIFSADGIIPAEDAASSWMIPISVAVGSNPSAIQELGLLEGKTKNFLIDSVGRTWVRLNPGTIGLYRCVYPSEMTDRLISAISQQTLAPMDRLGLQDDFFALCQAGKVGSVELLRLLSAFKGETDFNVWTSIDSCVAHLSIILANTDYKKSYLEYVRNLYNDIYEKLSWTARAGEGHTNTLTRSLVIKRLVASEHEGATAEALRLYRDQLAGGASVPADLRSPVYLAVAGCQDDNLFESLFALYRSTELHEEKGRILAALCSTTNSKRMDKVMTFTSSDEVRSQDIIYFFRPVSAHSPDVAWKYFVANKDLYRARYEGNHIMTAIIRCATENFSSEDRAKEIIAFFDANKFPGAERTIKQSLENIRLKAAWLARDSEAMKAYLTNL